MNYKKVFIASSALGYGLAFVFSGTLWWTMFIFLVPLLYVAATNRLSFTEGLFYGYVLWGTAASGVLHAIFSLGSGSLALRLVPVMFIITFEALFTSLWFFLSQKIIDLCKVRSTYAKLLVWAGTTYGYYYWVTQYSLSLSHHWEGYFLMHPLLPFMEYPALLSYVPSLGKEFLTILLILTNLAFTLPFIIADRRVLVAAPLIGLLPWLLSISKALPKKPAPAWLTSVAVLPKKYRTNRHLSPLARLMAKDMKQLLEKHPQVDLILLPEYALLFDLSTVPELASFFSTAHVGKPVHVIMGAYRWHKEKLFNASYWIYDGTIKQVFSKRHTMPLIEGMASWYNIPAIKQLYHTDLPPISAGTQSRIPIKLFEGVSFVPYICSELYFNTVPDDEYPSSVIIALCKDTWASMSYLHRLMYLAARFKALEWQRPILYVSYTYHGYLDTHGGVTALNS